jgi:HAD superfamily hydrolase (TIGR01549 family)
MLPHKKQPTSIAALFFDLGDTLMDEGTEIKDAEGTTQRAELIPGMADALRRFKQSGYPLGLVADSRPNTPANVLRQHGLDGLFNCLSVSEIVGASKPDPHIFLIALEALKIPAADYPRVLMVGNNLERDILGANRLGLTSVFFHWCDRRRSIPEDEAEQPDFTVTSAQELLDLVVTLSGKDLPTAGQPG